MTHYSHHYVKFPRHSVDRLFTVLLNWVVLLLCKVRITLWYYLESSPHCTVTSARINSTSVDIKLGQLCNTLWASPCQRPVHVVELGGGDSNHVVV